MEGEKEGRERDEVRWGDRKEGGREMRQGRVKGMEGGRKGDREREKGKRDGGGGGEGREG